MKSSCGKDFGFVSRFKVNGRGVNRLCLKNLHLTDRVVPRDDQPNISVVKFKVASFFRGGYVALMPNADNKVGILAGESPAPPC